MRPEDEYKVVTIVGHVITIIPAFLLGWQMGVLALLFWESIDSYYHQVDIIQEIKFAHTYEFGEKILRFYQLLS